MLFINDVIIGVGGGVSQKVTAWHGWGGGGLKRPKIA